MARATLDEDNSVFSTIEQYMCECHNLKKSQTKECLQCIGITLQMLGEECKYIRGVLTAEEVADTSIS